MTTRNLYITLFLVLFAACNYATKSMDQQTLDNSDINEIVNLVFDATVGPDTMWSKHLLIPSMFITPGVHQSKEDKIEYENYSKSIDSLKMKLDTAKLFVFINENLVEFPEDRRRIKSMTESLSFKANFSKIDTIFRPLVIKLIDSSVSQPLDISKLKSRYNYQVDYISKEDKYPKSLVKIGRVKISNPVFSSNLTMACIYSEIICGGECGGGSIIFLRKVKGQWKIEGSRELWVS